MMQMAAGGLEISLFCVPELLAPQLAEVAPSKGDERFFRDSGLNKAGAQKLTSQVHD